MSHDRRRLLRLALASAVAGWMPRSAWNQPRLRDDPFALGVASGSPEADSVVLWTRLLGDALPAQPVPVGWEVAHDERFERIARRGTALAQPDLAHSVHVEVDGLAPDRIYWYRFLVPAGASPVGRTRTLPAADADVARLRMAYASCQRWEHGYFSAWHHLRADDPDIVLFLGDYLYEYPTALGAVREPDGFWVTTLPQYRDRYTLYKSDAALQAMHAACPWICTWDDHEVQNDYAGLQPGQGGPAVADFPARRAAAYQAYYEHMPLRAAAFARSLQDVRAGGALRLYGTRRFGRLAALHLLDGRQYKDPQACTPGGRFGSGTLDPATCAVWNDPARSLLGPTQEAWLDAALRRGGATWSLIGQGTLFGQRDQRAGPGRTFWNDGWDGYPAARRRLVASLRHAANPVLFGGDVHENWVGHVQADYDRPDSPAVGVEFCGTSITSRPTAPERLPVRLAENPHFVFADARHRGYGLADFTRDRLQVRLRVLDDVTRPDSGVATLASFEVAAGRPAVHQA